MLTLAMVTWPASSSEIWSSAGAICLHGPHHSAQKSTSTGPEAFSTSDSKLSSVTFTVVIAFLQAPSGHVAHRATIARAMIQVANLVVRGRRSTFGPKLRQGPVDQDF